MPTRKERRRFLPMPQSQGYPRRILDEAPASWMTPEELASVLERVKAMMAYFQTHDPGTFAQALGVYRLLGQIARQQFTQQYGYLPEQSPIPRVRIEGTEQELKKLKPGEHQPKLFTLD